MTLNLNFDGIEETGFKFWDIESYDNLYCVGILDNNFLEMHYLVDDAEAEKEVFRACEDSGYAYETYNLAISATKLMHHFKKHIPTMGSDSVLAEFLGITEEEVKPKEGTYYSFNGLAYDIQMINYFESTVVAGVCRSTPKQFREHSDKIIQDLVRKVPTLPYEQYANQVDGAYLNETMIDKGQILIGLKTLIGMLGGSIIESLSNKSGHSDDIYGDVLYNINDISEFRDVVYYGTKLEITNTIRTSLLNMYADRLHRNGVTVNSTSAKFVENIIAPDEPIQDDGVCNLLYPAPHIAEEKGVERFDMLEYTKEWYMKHVYAQVVKHNPQVAQAHLAKFMTIYEFYNACRGKNWNDSSRHFLQYGIAPNPKEERKALRNIYGTYLPLIDKYGNDSYTHVNFSLGGIHGAEVFKEQLENDRQKVAELKDKYQFISLIPKNVVSTKLLNIIKKQSRQLKPGYEQYSSYPKHLLHEIPWLYHISQECDEILDPQDLTPFCYDEKTSKRSESLLERYRYTSTGFSLHQDFAGYYPMLLINLGVFYDGKGTDAYHEVYKHRIRVKNSLKTIPFGTKEWEDTNIEQEGYKLILNSASGVLDGSHDTKVRANNKAMAMRIIGQLMTWIIAQALALEGARVPSSNTDGIYVFDIEEELNKQIVDNELQKLLVSIDPEPCFLVSKDTNNRMEVVDGTVTSAKGGTLTSHAGPTVDKRLTHPAILDAVLAIYLQNEDIVNKPIDKDLISKAFVQYIQSIDKLKLVKMSAWVMRSTSGSIFIDSDDNVHQGTIRTWLTQDGLKLKRYATAKQKPSLNLDELAHNKQPESLLADANVVERLGRLDALKLFPDATTVGAYELVGQIGKPNKERTGPSVPVLKEVKIANLNSNNHVYINNNSILKMTDEELDDIIKSVDIESYINLVAETAKTWQNVLQPS